MFASFALTNRTCCSTPPSQFICALSALYKTDVRLTDTTAELVTESLHLWPTYFFLNVTEFA